MCSSSFIRISFLANLLSRYETVSVDASKGDAHLLLIIVSIRLCNKLLIVRQGRCSILNVDIWRRNHFYWLKPRSPNFAVSALALAANVTFFLLAFDKLAELFFDRVVLLLEFLALITANAAPLRDHFVVHMNYRVEAVGYYFLLLSIIRIVCSG